MGIGVREGLVVVVKGECFGLDGTRRLPGPCMELRSRSLDGGLGAVIAFIGLARWRAGRGFVSPGDYLEDT